MLTGFRNFCKPAYLKRLLTTFLVAGFIICSQAASAAPYQTQDSISQKDIRFSSANIAKADSVILPASSKPVRESIFGNKYGLSLALSHFTWGAELGASIDLRGYDLSTVDMEVLVGYKNSFLKLVGIGGGIHKSFGSNNTFLPLYAVFRSSFRSKPSLFFFNLQAGYCFTSLSKSKSRGGLSASVGVGINLATSKHFQSHIVLSYCYYHINSVTRTEVSLPVKYVDLARLSFGVNF